MEMKQMRADNWITTFKCQPDTVAIAITFIRQRHEGRALASYQVAAIDAYEILLEQEKRLLVGSLSSLGRPLGG